MSANLHLASAADLPPAPNYGEPVSLPFADGPVDLGTEDRDGQRIVRLVLEDGTAYLALTPDEARTLAVELASLATDWHRRRSLRWLRLAGAHPCPGLGPALAVTSHICSLVTPMWFYNLLVRDPWRAKGEFSVAENRQHNPRGGERPVNEAQRSHKMIQSDVAKGQKNGQKSDVALPPSGPPLLPPPVAPPPPEQSQSAKK